MTRFTSSRLPAYAGLAASGLIAALAMGRVEPVALAAPFLLALVVAAAIRAPRVSIAFSLDRDRAIEGDDVMATIDVVSGDGASYLDLTLTLPEHLTAAESPARGVVLRPDETQGIEIPLRCERWGSFSAGPVLFRIRDSLGFRSWEGQVGGRKQLRVYPSEETLRSFVAPLETQVFSGNQVSRMRGEGIEFADLRAWRTGDRLRRVNWRATALRGSLWVNEQHLERNADVVIFLDSFAMVRDQARRTHARAVRAAASLVHGYLQERNRVGVVGFGAFITWLRPASGLRQLYAIVDRLLTSEVAEGHEGQRAAVVPPRLIPPHAFVLALTPLFEERTASALVDLRGRGYDLVVVEIAPAEPAEARPAEAVPLAERLWRLSREAVRWRFAEIGVPVVTWREGEPLAAAIEEVNSFRRLARPA